MSLKSLKSQKLTLYAVILNVVKDLSGCMTVNRLGDLEMFHFVQHDNIDYQSITNYSLLITN